MIIDASVALKWLVPEEKSDLAALLIGQGDLTVPTLFHVEVGNAIWRKARKGEVVLDELAGEVANLAGLVRTIDETDLVPDALALAMAINHPIYDCIYLAMAIAQDDELITADRRFVSAVAQNVHGRRVREL